MIATLIINPPCEDVGSRAGKFMLARRECLNERARSPCDHEAPSAETRAIPGHASEVRKSLAEHRMRAAVSPRLSVVFSARGAETHQATRLAFLASALSVWPASFATRVATSAIRRVPSGGCPQWSARGCAA
jgi:hypothetical protein